MKQTHFDVVTPIVILIVAVREIGKAIVKHTNQRK